ncbi:unnamed protein product, partial [Prunus brigantina]
MRLSPLLPRLLLSDAFYLLLLLVIGLFTNLMFRMPFSMVTYRRRSIWSLIPVFAYRGRIWVKGDSFTGVLIYVDDILITGNNLQEMERLKSFLLKHFRIKDLGLIGARPEKFPMEQNVKLKPTDGDLLNDPMRYRLVGRLIYLTVTRTDIVYSVQILSQFMHQPRKPHMEATLRVLRFIQGMPGQGLFFPAMNNLQL